MAAIRSGRREWFQPPFNTHYSKCRANPWAVAVPRRARSKILRFFGTIDRHVVVVDFQSIQRQAGGAKPTSVHSPGIAGRRPTTTLATLPDRQQDLINGCGRSGIKRQHQHQMKKPY